MLRICFAQATLKFWGKTGKQRFLSANFSANCHVSALHSRACNLYAMSINTTKQFGRTEIIGSSSLTCFPNCRESCFLGLGRVAIVASGGFQDFEQIWPSTYSFLTHARFLRKVAARKKRSARSARRTSSDLLVGKCRNSKRQRRWKRRRRTTMSNLLWLAKEPIGATQGKCV